MFFHRHQHAQVLINCTTAHHYGSDGRHHYPIKKENWYGNQQFAPYRRRLRAKWATGFWRPPSSSPAKVIYSLSSHSVQTCYISLGSILMFFCPIELNFKQPIRAEPVSLHCNQFILFNAVLNFRAVVIFVKLLAKSKFYFQPHFKMWPKYKLLQTYHWLLPRLTLFTFKNKPQNYIWHNNYITIN